jgi:nicotinate-nucleotide pyrophosphorylase (carboxylating)
LTSPPGELPDLSIEPLINAALLEDLGRAGDITSRACIPPDARLSAAFAVRTSGVVAGLGCARLALARMDPTSDFEACVADGAHVTGGEILARVEANARALLGAERVALNLLCRLSGIATLTTAYVAEVEGTSARIVDTRKTTPSLRALEKYAVRCGGGSNHRFGLDDAILIKDNHAAACGGVGEAVRRARMAVGHTVKIEVEIDRLSQLDDVMQHWPDIVMLDNFDTDDMVRAVRIIDGRALVEASGGVNITTVKSIARTGVDLISVGALTHSAPILDIGLDAV